MYKNCNLNDRFFQWVIIKDKTDLNRQGKPTKKRHVLARCDCGREEIHLASNMASGDCHRCAYCRKHYPKEDLTNRRFGRLTVLSLKKDSKPPKWLCKCDCGNNKVISAHSLRRTTKATKSCGCKSTGCTSTLFTGYKEIHGTQWRRIRINAEKRNILFRITIEEAWELFEKQDRRCALSQIKIYFGKSLADQTTASLDRINSSENYTIDNIQWVHKDVNLIKWNLEQSYFLELCRLITYNNQELDKHIHKQGDDR